MSEEVAEERLSMDVTADCRLTEMGVEVVAHSKAANLHIEFDLDYDPEFVHGLLAVMPQIINDQLTKLVEDEETEDTGDTPP